MGILGDTGYAIWVYDSQRDLMTRLTFSSGFDGYPVWSPDGKLIAYESDRAEGAGNLYLIRADGGAEPQRLTNSRNPESPGSFSRDGKHLAFSEWNPDSGSDDIWTVPIDAGRAGGPPLPFLRTSANENMPAFSPDGKWLAYVSDESGKDEVYVRPFPGPGGEWQISTGGGAVPIWSLRDSVLFFKAPDRRIMATPFTVQGDSFSPEKPCVWSERQIPDSRLGQDFDLAPDGKRFIVQVLAETPPKQSALRLNILLNFFDELDRKLQRGTN